MNGQRASDGTVRHGVHIREHKHWNTKTIYNNGHVMRIYRRQPKQICFQSPMVNDFNQHLCGGWSMSDIGNEREATIQQLITRSKPLATITFGHDQKAEAEAGREQLHAAGLVARSKRHAVQGWNFDHIWSLIACHDMRVREIGDLIELQKDYAPIVEMGLLRDDIQSCGDIHLADFYNGPNSPPLPLWLMGLILGYPVENTISLYLE